MARICLCVNQIAQIRNLFNKREPDPAAISIAAEMAGIDGIVAQLREDRSDITDRDVRILKQLVQTHLNLATPLNDEMIKKAIQILPDMVTLLPSVPNEQTSLNVSENLEFIEDVVEALRANNIVSSILIDPDAGQIRAAARAGVDYVQLNTLPLSSVEDLGTLSDQIENIRSVSMAANKLGLGVSVGYGLNYQNIRELLDISTIEEINIGRAIIARSLLIGIEKAVQQIKNVTAST